MSSVHISIIENSFYFLIWCENALTRVLLLCESHNVDAINIVLLRKETDMYKCQSYWAEILILKWLWLTQVSNMSSARSFLRVGLTAKNRELLQCIYVLYVWFFFSIYTFCCTHSRDITAALFLPPVFRDEFHQLLLRVRLAWDGERLLHEGLIEIHFVQLQGQLLGHLEPGWQVTPE